MRSGGVNLVWYCEGADSREPERTALTGEVEICAVKEPSKPFDKALPIGVQASFQQLATVAADLNQATDQLSEAIDTVETAPKSLNLGIESWVDMSGYVSVSTTAFPGKIGGLRVGNAKISNRWCIAISEWFAENVETWPFSEAPRRLRVHAIDSIPELLSKLTKDAQSSATRIREKLNTARDLASALRVTNSKEGKR